MLSEESLSQWHHQETKVKQTKQRNKYHKACRYSIISCFTDKAVFISLNILKLSFFRLLKTRLKMLHCFCLVEHLFFANTESLVRFSFTFNIFEFYWNIEASLVKVGGGLPVIEFLENMGHREVSFKWPLDISFSPILLCLHKLLFKFVEAIGGLLIFRFDSFVELVLLH